VRFELLQQGKDVFAGFVTFAGFDALAVVLPRRFLLSQEKIRVI
jgi:hypothetical protein